MGLVLFYTEFDDVASALLETKEDSNRIFDGRIA